MATTRLAMAGTGTVSDGSPGHPALQGIRVCFSEPKGASEEACTSTDAAGHYTLAELNPGAYVVSFRAQPSQNLVTQYFEGASTYVDADPVIVGSGPLAGIDAEMHEGGTIAGTATAAGSAQYFAGIDSAAAATRITIAPPDTRRAGSTPASAAAAGSTSARRRSTGRPVACGCKKEKSHRKRVRRLPC